MEHAVHTSSDALGSHTDLPALVDADRIAVTNALNADVRKRRGQFMTPAAVAKFMAGMFSAPTGPIRLLDAGAGMGALTAAYVDARTKDPVERSTTIEVTAVEVDATLAARLQETLQACEVQCQTVGIDFSGQLVQSDFVGFAVEAASVEGMVDVSRLAMFDAAILNPPYTKIASDSDHRRQLRVLGIEATNLYSAFVAIAVEMLRPGGELVAITPRSFCNGPYFRQFRSSLLSRMTLRQIHIYESRKDAFRDDEVLQENVILHAVKNGGAPKSVRISTSSSSTHEDISTREVPYANVVHPGDPEAFIHIATNDEDAHLVDVILRQQSNLAALGLQVSTGRVVDFRAKEYLRAEPDESTVPLIYPAHFDNGFVSWPRAGGRKANALHFGPQTHDLMVKSGTYVLAKRFTSKEERRRVVACVYDPQRVMGGHEFVGFENHLNYFHTSGSGVEPKLARGLAIYLNSTAVDRFFRQFSGHTQVNATDLRNLRYPKSDDLRKLSDVVGDRITDQVAVDDAVSAVLN